MKCYGARYIKEMLSAAKRQGELEWGRLSFYNLLLLYLGHNQVGMAGVPLICPSLPASARKLQGGRCRCPLMAVYLLRTAPWQGYLQQRNSGWFPLPLQFLSSAKAVDQARECAPLCPGSLGRKKSKFLFYYFHIVYGKM